MHSLGQENRVVHNMDCEDAWAVGELGKPQVVLTAMHGE